MLNLLPMKKHLVMLHGFGCDSRVFSSIAGHLSKDLDVMMVDIPGHGQTKGEFGDFSFCAHTILHALDSYIGEPYSLIGWSMGGQIALEMFKQKSFHKCKDEHCAHNPITSLILISTTPRFVEGDDFPVGMNKAVFSKFKKGIKDDTQKTMDGFYDLIFSKSEYASKYVQDLKPLLPSPQTLIDCMESFERFDYRKLLPSITVPTLLITGDCDKIVDPKCSMYMSQEIKNSTLRVYNGAGHAPFLTNEEAVIEDVRRVI